jgi:hypothetical protein
LLVIKLYASHNIYRHTYIGDGKEREEQEKNTENPNPIIHIPFQRLTGTQNP